MSQLVVKKIPLYGPQDLCVICGAYMAEGSGMVCQSCMRKLQQENQEKEKLKK